MRCLFFAYRDWAIDIYKNTNIEDKILISNKNLCNIDFIDNVNPDIIFFYGWSWIVPDNIINKYNCLCLHPSDLPKYRGGSPIQNQIIDGVSDTSVTIFKMTDKLDSGEIFYKMNLSLDGYLEDILSRITTIGTIGTNYIIENIDNIKTYKQEEKLATYCKRRKPEDSEIFPADFKENEAKYFYDKVRCLQEPYPEVFIKCKEGKIILERIRYEI